MISRFQQHARLDGLDGVDMVELNISCPNVAAGGAAFGVVVILGAAFLVIVAAAGS